MARKEIETAMAHLKLDERGLIFVRIKAGVRLDNGGYLENVAARKELADGNRCGVVCIIPKDMDFDVEILSMDHYSDTPVAEFTAAMAIVTGDLLYDRLFKLHAKQFLNGVPHRVFHREAEAVKWVMEQLHERGRD